MKKAIKNMKKAIKKINPIEIKIALIRKGITQQDIAKRLGVTRQAVNMAIHKGTSKKILKYIHEILGSKL